MIRQTSQRMRGRPREFDTDEAIESAMGVFWSSGYHATSLPDLLEATNLSRGSLYAAFGDKHGLFLRALGQYIADSLTRLDADLDPQKDALEGIRACLARYVERTSGAGGKRGCLVVATAMELGSHDAEVEQRIRRFFKAMETRLAAALGRAKSEGRLADGDRARDRRSFAHVCARRHACRQQDELGPKCIGSCSPDPARSLCEIDVP